MMLKKVVCLALLVASPVATCLAEGLPADVLVRQDGIDVRFEDVDRFAETIPEKDRAGFFDSPKRIEQVLQNLLSQKLVARDVRENHIGSDPILKAQAAQTPDDVLFRQQIERIRDASNVPDMTALAEESYQADRKRYVEAGRIDADYILVKTELERARGKPKADSVAAAQQRAAELMKRVDGSSEHFDAISRELAESGQADIEVGQLEDVGSDRHPDALQAAARSAAGPGAVTGPVETVSGFYILKVTSRVEDRQLSFAEVKDAIIEQKQRDYVRLAVDEYVGGLRKTPLEANPEALASLRDRYATPAAKSSP
ncbi:MAG TPA: peptidylprolyl isomerase [Dokdonella sp.]|uniref:peptidylprolyl isomerase n=1 Tax=Dokdonella sp. TaxID=2291710 RepID=UPI002BA8C40F|nr:peptidylprolyl isomerase [Dokdonella sp.]HUD43818.1 peptidylprolyl isomerase [Dokdonella sp.]